MGSPVPTNYWMGIPADSLILSLSFDLIMLINELRMNCLGTIPILTLAVQGILKPRIRRIRGSGCNPNSENISLLTTPNLDSDMGTTLETINKNLWLDSNYTNFNGQVKENHIPLRFLNKYFIHPFSFSIFECTYLAKKIQNICHSQTHQCVFRLQFFSVSENYCWVQCYKKTILLDGVFFYIAAIQQSIQIVLFAY